MPMGRNRIRLENRTLDIPAPGVESILSVTGANPAKVEDFGDKDLLQNIDFARILFGEVIPPRREAR
jgi:hypothetical protein